MGKSLIKLDRKIAQRQLYGDLIVIIYGLIGGSVMRVILYKEALKDFEGVLDRVVNGHEMTIIARKKDKSVVILPLDDWMVMKNITDNKI